MTTDTFIPSSENINHALLLELRSQATQRLSELDGEHDILQQLIDDVPSDQPTADFVKALAPIKAKQNILYGERKALRLALGLS